MEGERWSGKDSHIYQNHLILQLWALELEGALDMLHHCDIRFERFRQHYRVCGTRPLL